MVIDLKQCHYGAKTKFTSYWFSVEQNPTWILLNIIKHTPKERSGLKQSCLLWPSTAIWGSATPGWRAGRRNWATRFVFLNGSFEVLLWWTLLDTPEWLLRPMKSRSWRALEQGGSSAFSSGKPGGRFKDEKRPVLDKNVSPKFPRDFPPRSI